MYGYETAVPNSTVASRPYCSVQWMFNFQETFQVPFARDDQLLSAGRSNIHTALQAKRQPTRSPYLFPRILMKTSVAARQNDLGRPTLEIQTQYVTLRIIHRTRL